jgi:hypothetical protein
MDNEFDITEIGSILSSTETITLSSNYSLGDVSYQYNGPTFDTISINTDYDKNKNLVKNGVIPVDIWARIYNNGKIDD